MSLSLLPLHRNVIPAACFRDTEVAFCRLWIQLRLRVPRPADKSRILRIVDARIHPRSELLTSGDHKVPGNLEIVFDIPKSSTQTEPVTRTLSSGTSNAPQSGNFRLSINLSATVEEAEGPEYDAAKEFMAVIAPLWADLLMKKVEDGRIDSQW